jgi:hypothetical protein
MDDSDFDPNSFQVVIMKNKHLTMKTKVDNYE